MTNLAYMMFNDMPGGIGLWMFLSIGAISLFMVFIPTVVYLGNRRKEREAYYRAETMRRIGESSSEGAKAVLEHMREQARLSSRHLSEGMKIGGVIDIGVGIGLIIFLRVLLGTNGVFLCGLVPLFIGVGMLVYVYVLASPIE